MGTRALVLTSGGLDSAVCLGHAVHRFGNENVVALNMYYGQKHDIEIENAQKLAAYYAVQLIELDLSKIMQYSDCTLLQGRGEMTHKSYAEQIAENGEGVVDTYVPFRNGLFLSAAGSIALSKKCDVIYYGAHSDDAAGNAYPDCSQEFYDAMSKALYTGSGDALELKAPLIQFNKAEVVALGLTLKVPFELTHSCYEGVPGGCGTCATCIDRRQAFISNGIVDPTIDRAQALVDAYKNKTK